MPKLGIAVDEQAYRLLKKYGGQRNIGALIGRLVRQHDKDENLNLSAIREQLDRLDNHLLELLERENKS